MNLPFDLLNRFTVSKNIGFEVWLEKSTISCRLIDWIRAFRWRKKRISDEGQIYLLCIAHEIHNSAFKAKKKLGTRRAPFPLKFHKIPFNVEPITCISYVQYFLLNSYWKYGWKMMSSVWNNCHHLKFFECFIVHSKDVAACSE